MSNPPLDSGTRARKALGRGLHALLDGRPSVVPPRDEAQAAPAPQPLAPPAGQVAGKTLLEIAVEAIEPNPDQPRKNFAPEQLKELADSIRAQGLLQPVIVTPIGPAETASRYQLVAGERRWRAAMLAGLSTIPALLQEIPANASLEVALIENLQREDLNPIEAANAFARLAGEFNLTHEDIAQRTGKDRATVTNFLRLLRLPASVQALVAEGKLSAGHARALLALPTTEAQQKLAAQVVARGMTVRAVEELARSRALPKTKEQEEEEKLDPNVQAALDEMRARLGTKVSLEGTTQRGKLIIEYYSAQDLMRLYDHIMCK